MTPDHGARGDDAAFSDRDAGEDDAMLADPYSVADDDWTNVLRSGRLVCPTRHWFCVVAVGVHDCNVTGEANVASDRDELAYVEPAAMADS